MRARQASLLLLLRPHSQGARVVRQRQLQVRAPAAATACVHIQTTTACTPDHLYAFIFSMFTFNQLKRCTELSAAWLAAAAQASTTCPNSRVGASCARVSMGTWSTAAAAAALAASAPVHASTHPTSAGAGRRSTSTQQVTLPHPHAALHRLHTPQPNRSPRTSVIETASQRRALGKTDDSEAVAQRLAGMQAALKGACCCLACKCGMPCRSGRSYAKMEPTGDLSRAVAPHAVVRAGAASLARHHHQQQHEQQHQQQHEQQQHTAQPPTRRCIEAAITSGRLDEADALLRKARGCCHSVW